MIIPTDFQTGESKLKKILVCAAIAILSVPASALAEELKILVVISSDTENLSDGNQLYAVVEDTVGDAFEDANLARPTFVLSALRPTFSEDALDKNGALALAFTPTVSDERYKYNADLVLLVLSSTSPLETACGAANGISTATPNYLVDVANGTFAYRKIAKHAAYITTV